MVWANSMTGLRAGRCLALALGMWLAGWAQAQADIAPPEPSIDWRTVLPNTYPDRATPLIEAQQAQITVAPGVALQVSKMQGSLHANNTDGPITLDQPERFAVQIDQGELLLPQEVMVRLVQAELAAKGAPLRIKTVEVSPQEIRIGGQIRRLGVWLKLEVAGQLSPQGNEVVLTPSELKVAGIPVYGAVLATNLQLQALVDMKTPAIALKGQTMVLRPQHLLNAPQLNFQIAELQLGQGQIRARLGDGSGAFQPFCRENCPYSYVYLQGGRLQASGITLPGPPALLTGPATAPLTVALTDLARVVHDSEIRLRRDGALWVNTFIGNPAKTELDALAAGRKAMASLSRQKTPVPEAHTLLVAKNSTLTTPQGVSIGIDHLIAHTPTRQLEALGQSHQNILYGRVSLNNNALDALMNNSLFAYTDSPIRRVRSQISSQGIDITLQVKPKLLGVNLFFMPARLVGELQTTAHLEGGDPDELVFAPSQARVFGLPVLPVLNWLGWTLDKLVQVDQPAVQMRGNQLFIRMELAMPPLQLAGPITAVSHQAEVLLELGDGQETSTAQYNDALNNIADGLWLQAPAFAALGAQTGPTLAHLAPPEGSRLNVALDQYLDLLEGALIRMPGPGQMLILVGNSR